MIPNIVRELLGRTHGLSYARDHMDFYLRALCKALDQGLWRCPKVGMGIIVFFEMLSAVRRKEGDA